MAGCTYNYTHPEMTLTFSLLAVDDQPETISGAVHLLRDHLRDRGFRLDEKAIDFDDTSSLINYESGAYDLVIIDFNLGGIDKDGLEEAKNFRKKNLYNEMIFYSGQEELSGLRSKLSKAAVDGVFLSTREDLGEALIGVADIVIGKLTNVNFMRGIAMAEVAEIDMVMLKTLIDVFRDDSNDDQKELTTHVTEKFKKHKAGLFKRTKERLEEHTLLNILGDDKGTVSSSELCLLIGWIDDKIKVLDRESYRDIDYAGKVLAPRNNLAHRVEERVDGGPPVLRSLNKKKPPVTINEEWMIDYRNTLLKTREDIKSIYNTLRQNLLGRDTPDDA